MRAGSFPTDTKPMTEHDFHCFVLPAKKFAEMQPKKETPSKKEKGGKEAGKPQEKKEKKKEEKKEEKKPDPEEEMDDCDAVLAAEPKAKDPFAHLPKR